MAEPPVPALDCNCSVCRMIGFIHVIVPHEQFELVSGRDALTSYSSGLALRSISSAAIAG